MRALPGRRQKRNHPGLAVFRKRRGPHRARTNRCHGKIGMVDTAPHQHTAFPFPGHVTVQQAAGHPQRGEHRSGMTVKQSLGTDYLAPPDIFKIMTAETDPSALMDLIRGNTPVERSAVVHVKPVAIVLQQTREPLALLFHDRRFVAANVEHDPQSAAVGEIHDPPQTRRIMRMAAVLNIGTPVFMQDQHLRPRSGDCLHRLVARVTLQIVKIMIHRQRGQSARPGRGCYHPSPAVAPLPRSADRPCFLRQEIPPQNGIAVFPADRRLIVRRIAGRHVVAFHEEFRIA